MEEWRNYIAVLLLLSIPLLYRLNTDRVWQMYFDNYVIFWTPEYALLPECDSPWECANMTKSEWWNTFEGSLY